MLQAIAALIPSIGVGILFYFIIRAIIRADRGERTALAEAEREDRALHGKGVEAPSVGTLRSPSPDVKDEIR